MSEEIRVSRTSPQVSSPASGEAREDAARKSSKTPWIILAVIVVVLAVVGVMFRDKLFGKKGTAGLASASEYQAVFLTNGQVYFGKIANTQENYVTLKDIYYLQVGPQQGSGAAATDTQQSISLVKLGQELHGPVDEMHISRSQILFYEDLKGDGQVVKAIVQDKAAKK